MMTAEKRYSNTTYMVLCGLFAALTAICSFISVPLGFTPVPMNLGTLAVFLTGGILGKKYGVISIVVYVLLGAAGIPVFAGFRAGLSVLAGPTGGYIIGYIVAVFVIGIILDNGFRRLCAKSNAQTDIENGFQNICEKSGELTSKTTKSSKSHPGSRIHKTTLEVFLCAGAMIIGLILCYALGTAWFMFSTGAGLLASLVACVFPFLIGDAVKIIAASILVQRLRPVLR